MTQPTATGGERPADLVVIRPLATDAERAACVALQHEVWGAEFDEAVPRSLLEVVQRLGGVAAGAFDASGALLGFVFGITGVQDGRVVHWCDMVAVRPGGRDAGLGGRLMRWEREAARAVGAARMYWSYDPLVARNAHLNLARLGARVVEYVEDMYGSSTSELHQGLGTDRFVVAWETGGDAPTPVPLPPSAADAPVLNADPEAGAPATAALDGDSPPPVARVAIPRDIGVVQAASLALAAAWRASTRAALVPALARGYRVVGFARDGGAERSHYVLARTPETDRLG